MMSITKSDVTFIAEAVKETCISLYLPTHVAGQEIRQDPIRLKNLLNDVQQQLINQGRDSDSIEALLSPAFHLLDDSQYAFWEHQGEGLVLFIAESFFHTYRVGYSLPQMAVVGDRFHITPLLPVLHQVDRFLLLSLSQNEAQLYGASPTTMRPVSLEELPNSLEEALKYDDPEEQLQYHSQGAPRPTYHGQGVGTTAEEEKDRIRRYCQQLDQAICAAVPADAPLLVLAGVDFVQDIFREVSKYPNLVDSGLGGNPEAVDASELHRRALDMLEPLTQSPMQDAWDTYKQMTGSDKITDRLQDILTAANRGQVDTLFLQPERSQWGRYNPETAQLELHEQNHPESDDLLNLAAIYVLLNSGVVYPKSMASESPIAAILRFPLYADQETSAAIRS